MRELTIDFNRLSDKPALIGYDGEHNAVCIRCVLPEYMIIPDCNYIIEYVVNGNKIDSTVKALSEESYITDILPMPVMQSGILRIQVTAFKDNNLIVKTPVLQFDINASVSGIDAEYDNTAMGLISELSQILADLKQNDYVTQNELGQAVEDAVNAAMGKASGLYEHYSNLPETAQAGTIAYVLNDSAEKIPNASTLDLSGNTVEKMYFNPWPVTDYDTLIQYFDEAEDVTPIMFGSCADGRWFKIIGLTDFDGHLGVSIQTGYNHDILLYSTMVFDFDYPVEEEAQSGDISEETVHFELGWNYIQSVITGLYPNHWHYLPGITADFTMFPVIDDFTFQFKVNEDYFKPFFSDKPFFSNHKKAGYYQFQNNAWTEYSYQKDVIES